MDFGSDCSGPCIVCRYSGGCLAGHGDDDFTPMSYAEISEMVRTNWHPKEKRCLREWEWRAADTYLQLQERKRGH